MFYLYLAKIHIFCAELLHSCKLHKKQAEQTVHDLKKTNGLEGITDNEIIQILHKLCLAPLDTTSEKRLLTKKIIFYNGLKPPHKSISFYELDQQV